MMKSYGRIVSTLKKVDTSKIKVIGRLNNSDFSRNRKMPIGDIIRCILNKRGKTLTMEINNYFKEINKREQRVSKQAFCKQRSKLNPQVFAVLNEEYVESIYNDGDYNTYKGYILTAVDGSILEIPNTEELREQFGYQNNNKGKRKAARAKASCIYDLENNLMIDAIIDKYNAPERALAKENIKTMLSILGGRKAIIIFDRGYVSTEMLMFLRELPVLYLFRVQGNNYTNEKKSMKTDDEIVNVKTDGDRLTNISDYYLKQRAKELKNMPVRMIKITLKTGEEEYLMTNIPFKEMCTKELGDLYFKRWGIETAYDIIKNKLYIENISGKKKIIVEQDFYSQILLFNMIEDLRNDANQELKQKKQQNLKYDYKVNINILVGTFREYMIKIAIEDNQDRRKNLYEYMLEEIMGSLVPIRPKRNFVRKPYEGRNKNKINLRRNS